MHCISFYECIYIFNQFPLVVFTLAVINSAVVNDTCICSDLHVSQYS